MFLSYNKLLHTMHRLEVDAIDNYGKTTGHMDLYGVISTTKPGSHHITAPLFLSRLGSHHLFPLPLGWRPHTPSYAWPWKGVKEGPIQHSVPLGNYSDCLEAKQNLGQTYTAGIHFLNIKGRNVPAECDADGWTVIQSRGQMGNPTNYFYRDWDQYVAGFGLAGNMFRNYFKWCFKRSNPCRQRILDRPGEHVSDDQQGLHSRPARPPRRHRRRWGPRILSRLQDTEQRMYRRAELFFRRNSATKIIYR